MRIEKVTDKIKLYNCDCMEYMKDIPDKYYDLAIVDPPYGIGISSNPIRQSHKRKQWDESIPQKKYFEELFRISKNQIVWGGNYFIEYLRNTQNFIIWDKKQPEQFSLAMCELGWTSFKSPAKIYRKSVLEERNKIHPTQKPVKLYEWILKNYAKPTDKILDTHFGSCSIGIACHNFGCSLDACELDEEYFDNAFKRVRTHVRQLDLFK